MKSPPQNVSEAVRKLNPHLYGGTGQDAVGSCEIHKQATNLRVSIAHPPKRIRQSTKPLMNKLEQEWFNELQAHFTDRTFFAQCIKFRLGNGIVYTPDIFSFDYKPVTAWEVKGKYAHRGGFENLKVAASKYPNIAWVLVWKEQARWKTQTVLP